MLTQPERPRLEPVPALSRTTAYRVPRLHTPIQLALDGNEGVRPPAALLDRLSRIDGERLRRYPDAAELEASIARAFDIDPDRVLVTAGADDALDRAMRATLAPGRELVLPVPTFEMIERYARIAGASIVCVPWESGAWPLAGVLSAITDRTRCVVIVSPNNPTGLEATLDDLRNVSEAAPGALIVVDQAYAEFGEVDFAELVSATPNAILVRSLSKAFGLAGLRVGYVLGSAVVVRWLRAVGQPFAVSGPSIALAEARFAMTRDDIRSFVDVVRRERAELAAIVTGLGWRPLASRANFVFFRTDDADAVWGHLWRRGIAVRSFRATRGLEDALRITCPGDPAAFAVLATALGEIAGDLAASRGAQ